MKISTQELSIFFKSASSKLSSKRRDLRSQFSQIVKFKSRLNRFGRLENELSKYRPFTNFLKLTPLRKSSRIFSEILSNSLFRDNFCHLSLSQISSLRVFRALRYNLVSNAKLDQTLTRFALFRLISKTTKRLLKFPSMMSYDRLWQKFYIRLFSNDAGKDSKALLKNFKNLQRIKPTKTHSKVQRTSFKNFSVFPFFPYSVSGVLEAGFGLQKSLINKLASIGMFFVNGNPVTSGNQPLRPNDILKVCSVGQTWFLQFLLYRFFHETWPNATSIQLRSSSWSTFSEVSFKLNEIVLLRYDHSSFNAFPRAVFEVPLNLSNVFLQRYYLKQKSFGLGRLL